MRVTHDELEKIVDKFEKDHTESSHIYVIMRWGYCEVEMLNSPYQVELLIYDGYERVWETDWWEGEEYIDLLAVCTDEDVVMAVRAAK